MPKRSPRPSADPAPLRVSVTDQQSALTVERERIRAAVMAVLLGEKCQKAKISIVLVDDPTIHELNKRFLQHDCPTDVLTFPLENGPQGLEAELIVSSDTALRQAAEYGTSGEHELLLYVIHGLLHLFDYDDHDPGFARQMRLREEYYLQQLGIAKTTAGGSNSGDASCSAKQNSDRGSTPRQRLEKSPRPGRSGS